MRRPESRRIVLKMNALLEASVIEALCCFAGWRES